MPTKQQVYGCALRMLVSLRKPPVPVEKRKQPTGARDELARQVGLAQRAVSADESKSNNIGETFDSFHV